MEEGRFRDFCVALLSLVTASAAIYYFPPWVLGAGACAWIMVSPKKQRAAAGETRK